MHTIISKLVCHQSFSISDKAISSYNPEIDIIRALGGDPTKDDFSLVTHFDGWGRYIGLEAKNLGLFLLQEPLDGAQELSLVL
jgi:hypothetical protein